MVYDDGWRNHPDLARFVIEVQKAVRGESGRVLNRQMAEWMTTRLMGGYGLGLQITERGFQHGGATPGYRGWLAGCAESGDGIVVMTNGDGGAVLLVPVDAGKLWIGSPSVDGERWELVAVGTDRFLLVEENEGVEFQRDANGAVVEMRVARQGGQTLITRREAPRPD